MRKVGKLIRVITIPPIVTGITVLLLYLFASAMPIREFIVAELCFLIIPSLAYPLREIFHIGVSRRDGQRSTAFVLSAIGYASGFLWSIATDCSPVTRVLFTSYVLSVVVLILLNKVIGFKASGHACSMTAPIVLLTWQLHKATLIPCLLLIVAVYYSSIKLNRHTFLQLITGSAISVAAGITSILLY